MTKSDSLDQLPMRKETIFNADGSYRFVLENNIILHREANERARAVLSTWMGDRKSARVLDLGCGGLPTIPAAFMEAFPGVQFEYIGIDLNRDQVESARAFSFSKNVKAVFEEGDAWNLGSIENQPDIVFIGLNTHHATSVQLEEFARGLVSALKPGGIFLNHDSFKPEGSGEDWKGVFIEKMARHLRESGADDEVIETQREHILTRDFPLKMSEVSTIFGGAGLRCEEHHYRAQHPLEDYYGFFVARK